MNLILPVSATKASLVFTGSPAHALASYALSQIAETLLESYEKGTLLFLLALTTSISSYSKENEMVEFGYNRDYEDLPQINLGLVVDIHP